MVQIRPPQPLVEAPWIWGFFLWGKHVKRKLLAVLSLCSFFSSFSLWAEPEPNRPLSGLSVGVDVGSISGHLTNGVRISSPSFFGDYARATFAAHLGWVQNATTVASAANAWLPYGLFKLGLALGDFMPDLPIRLVGVAEVALVAPSYRITNKPVIVGFSGGLDVEFFMNPHRNHALFVAMGGIGLLAPMADGLKGRPSFANGFSTNFGYRYYF